ncbi:MAG: proprotein convertase P-domain-containing protein [Bacteroidia bacterium]|nr:proprotein convertase P-domain-containing protein [Bacteroidia bacterium]
MNYKTGTLSTFKGVMATLLLVTLIAIGTFEKSAAQTVLISPSGNGGFESGTTFPANGWTVVNSASGNSWVVGTVAKSAGARGAYISNNSGTSNNYSNFGLFSTASRTVHFYRDVTFPAGETQITLDFKWRCNGESGADYIKVSLAPTSVTPVTGTDINATYQVAGPYSGQGSVFQTVSVTIPASNAGTTKRLIFTWINNNNLIGSNPAGAFDEISLTTCTPPVVSASNNGPVCAGGDINLSATGGGTYSWTGPNGFSSASANPTVSNMGISKVGTYTVTVTNSGCSATTTTNVSYNPAPSGTPSSSPATVCSGSSVALNSNLAVDFGSSNTTDFSIPDNNSTGITSSTLAVGSGLNANQVTSVKVNITHTYTGDLTLTLRAPNGSTIDLSSGNGGSGNNYTNTVFVTGGTPVTSGAAPFTGNFAPEQAFSGLTGTAHGTWALIVKDLAGTDVGTLLDWTLAIQTTSGISYSWTANNSGFTASSASTSDSPTASTIYSVQGTYLGCSATQNLNLAVLDLPVINATSNAPVCEGTDLILNASGGNTYSWTGPSFGSGSQNPVINSATQSNEGSYTVVATDLFGCSNSQTLVVDINEVPVVSFVSQTNITCNGWSDGEIIATATGGSGFYLYSDGSNINFDGIFSGLPAGNYNITAIDAFSCEGVTPATLTQPDPTTVADAGSDNVVCDGSSVLLNANTAVVGVGTWSVSSGTGNFTDPNNAATSLSGTSIGANVMRWTIDNGVCGSNFDELVINTNELPQAAISGSTTICSGQSAQLTINFTGAGPWTYSYTNGLNNFGPFTTNNNPEIISVAPVVTRTYVVSNVSDLNCAGVVSGSAQVVVNVGLPGGTIATGAIVSPPTACAGNVINVACNSVSNVNGYTWSVTSGTLIDGQSGPYTTNTPNATLTLGSVPPNSSGWLVCVMGSNACGNTNQKCFNIRGNLSTPGVIAGDVVACENSVKSYSVPAVAGAENYSWSVSPGMTIVSGAGTNNITVSFAPGFTQGNLCVAAGLNCGFTGLSRCLVIKNITPALGNLTGPFALCPGQTNQVFSVPSVAGAASYNWTIPSNVSVVSGQGTPSLVLNVGNNFNIGQLCVEVVSNCGLVSSTRCKTIYSTIPQTPSLIAGQAGGVCGQTLTYAVPSAPGINSYNWSLPSGASFVSPNGSNSVDISFINSMGSGQICVSSVNSCGSSIPRCMNVKGIPADAGNINGANSVCPGEQGLMFSINAVQGANNYIWTVPTGATIIAGQNTTSIIVDWGTASGAVTVKASNDCGFSGTKVFNVSVGCRIASTAPEGFMVYPNPAREKATISFESKTSSTATIKMTDIAGRILFSENMEVSKGKQSVPVNLYGIKPGTYLVQVESNGELMIAKLTVQ